MLMTAPPPPPMKTLVLSPQQSSIGVHPPGSPQKPAAPETQDSDVGFLSDIRGKQVILLSLTKFLLKKAQVITKEERKKQNEPEGVAAILMRRAAVEESDSGGEEDGDDDWN
jgi:hypothetical protein